MKNLVAISLSIALLSACSSIGKFASAVVSPGEWTAKNNLSQVDIVTSKESNGGRGIELALVFLESPEDVAKLPTDANQWFDPAWIFPGIYIEHKQSFSARAARTEMTIPDGVRQARSIWLMARFDQSQPVAPFEIASDAKRVAVEVGSQQLASFSAEGEK